MSGSPLPAQNLPEVAIHRISGLCGTGSNLASEMREVHRAINENRLRTTGTAEAVVTGTLNVDIGDVAVIAEFFGQAASAKPEADLNGNGVIDIGDVAEIAAEFGQSVG